MVTFTEADNGKTESVTQNSQFAVVLAENPSTRFMWNATWPRVLSSSQIITRMTHRLAGPGAGGNHT